MAATCYCCEPPVGCAVGSTLDLKQEVLAPLCCHSTLTLDLVLPLPSAVTFERSHGAVATPIHKIIFIATSPLQICYCYEL